MEDSYSQKKYKAQLYSFFICYFFWTAGILTGTLSYVFYNKHIPCDYFKYNCPDATVKCIGNCSSLNNSNLFNTTINYTVISNITDTYNTSNNNSISNIYNNSISNISEYSYINKSYFVANSPYITPKDDPILREEQKVDTGVALAISIISVFGFVGCCLSSIWFIKNKPNPIKNYVTNRTKSIPIRLTDEEREIVQINPIVKAMQQDDRIIGQAIRDITLAIEKDNGHYFDEAVNLYNSGVDKLMVYMKYMTNGGDRFHLAKKIDKYVTRANQLTALLQNKNLIDEIGQPPSKPLPPTNYS